MDPQAPKCRLPWGAMHVFYQRELPDDFHRFAPFLGNTNLCWHRKPHKNHRYLQKPKMFQELLWSVPLTLANSTFLLQLSLLRGGDKCSCSLGERALVKDVREVLQPKE